MSPYGPSLDYPTSFGEIGAWARESGVPLSEARQRFAQYAILRGIASSASLRELLVFKGGNALDFIWSPNRSTRDLDFSVDMTRLQGQDFVEMELQNLLSSAFATSGPQLGIVMAVHRVKRQPPGKDKTFATYTARVGYALPDDQRNRTLLVAGRPSNQVVPIEISINEPIGADESIPLGGSTRFLRVSTLNDIVAEKLRAFLQQKRDIRNRNRPQDLLDIALLLQRNLPLSLGEISHFLLEKADARGVPVSKEAFREPELAARASYEYEELRNTVRVEFVSFDKAIEILYDLIERLDIPEK